MGHAPDGAEWPQKWIEEEGVGHAQRKGDGEGADEKGRTYIGRRRRRTVCKLRRKRSRKNEKAKLAQGEGGGGEGG